MRFFIGLIFLLIFGSVRAQDPFFRIIDKSEGLPSNTIYDIIQDKKGYIWISHDEGVSKYDGFSFATFSNNAQTSKPGSALQEDKYGRIWYSNFDGYIYYIENGKMNPLQMGAPLGFTRFGIGENTLYAVEQDGIAFYDLLTLQRVGKYKRKMKTYSSSSMVGNSFVFQDTVFYVFKNRQLRRIISPKEIPGFKKGFVLFGGPSNTVVLAQREKAVKYIVLFDLENGFKVVPANFKGFVQNFSLAGNYIWGCTPMGVKGFTPNGNNFWNMDNPIFSQYNISNVFKDRFNNYWFSTLTEGLIFVPNLNAKFIGSQSVKPYRLNDSKEEVLVGARGGNIYSINKNNESKLLVSTHNYDITRLAYDTNAKHLIYANRFFQILNESGKQIYYTQSSIKDFTILNSNYIAFAASGRIGLIKLNPKVKMPFWDSLFASCPIVDDKECSFVNTSVRGKSVALNADRSAIYYATNVGLFKVSKAGVRQIYYKGETIFAQKIRLAGNKLFYLSGQNILHQILPNDEIKPVATALRWKNIRYSNGYLFLIGDNYLNALCVADSFNNISSIDYPTSKFELNDVVFKYNSLYLATNAGLVIYPLLPSKENVEKPPFYITKVSIGGKTVLLPNAGNFAFDKNEVEINYAILNYKQSFSIPLYYQINDGNWVPSSPQTRNLKLPALSPGKYTIRFKFENLPQEVEYVAFEINKPYYLQWWFFLLGVLFMSGLILLYYQLRLSQLKDTNRLQMEKIELEKSLGQSMLTAIKSQMNPHFFYNALNTIQSYIFTNEGPKATAYLSKFSKLTRLILEMSEKELVPLTDELRALHLYLELEQGRFNDNDFHFVISVDENVEQELIQIPSMLIQPYVENAIKHGLLHKRNSKELLIRMSRTEDTLQVEVTDNGIGRENASKINAARKELYHSFATHANQKRLEILNKGRTRSIGVEIIDHVGANLEANGTSVFISIPINEEG